MAIIITVPQCAVKISAEAAADNFGWLGGALSVFRRPWRRKIPAGGPFGGLLSGAQK